LPKSWLVCKSKRSQVRGVSENTKLLQKRISDDINVLPESLTIGFYLDAAAFFALPGKNPLVPGFLAKNIGQSLIALS
jgi:hypothetical protein